MCVSHRVMYKLFAIPWTLAHQTSQSMGFSRQEYWSGYPLLSPGDLSDPGIEPMSYALQANYHLGHQGSPLKYFMCELLCVHLVVEFLGHQFRSVQSLSCVQHFVTPWTAARQASLSITNAWSLLKLMTIKSVMPSNHLILCCYFLLLASIFPSIRIFSNESVLPIR